MKIILQNIYEKNKEILIKKREKFKIIRRCELTQHDFVKILRDDIDRMVLREIIKVIRPEFVFLLRKQVCAVLHGEQRIVGIDEADDIEAVFGLDQFADIS